MGVSKEQRIKELKKKRIWPSVLGLFLIILIFSAIMIVAVTVSALDVVDRKLTDSSNMSVKIAKLFEAYGSENGKEIEKTVLSHINILDEIEAVSVIDEDENPVWSSNGEYPSLEDAAKVDYLPGITKNMEVIVAEDKAQVFIVDERGLNVDDSAVVNFKSLFNNESDDVTIALLKLWLVVPVNDMKVMVLNNTSIYVQDIQMALVCIIGCGLTIGVFVIYYLISIISMALSVRKTTKIIYTDMLTGGDNWLAFIKKGRKLLKKGIVQQKYAMLHLEMRKYRSFCTCFGVNRGQELIEAFYAVLKKEIKNKEVMAHQENSAFGLLLAYTDTAQLEARIHQIESALNTVLPAMKMYFGVGVYLVQPGERDIEQLYNNAMIACEMLGEESENKIAYFDVEMNNQKIWERKVEDDMERALVNKEFQVYLQPKISTSEEVLGGAEALVRWIHPTEGFIPPNRFIPIFEKNGFILKLDDYMLEEIAKVQAEWLAEGRKLVPISVNVSRAHFTREDLAEHICTIVDKYEVPHSVIELELTESAFFDDKKVLLNTVQKLRAAGFQVSMDDFGAGYSSLNSLKELQIDVLKIDADFFRGADVEERGLLIVSEVIDLAKKLDMKIVAEGIESKEQVEFLTEQECDLIQGYFYSKPMPVAEFAQKYNT
ncbi:MAG: EAL domain-containing protein [Ruminiclostridium sp.]|nr:EAL domain-containing protein [Ruminiclostridium sp.]